MMYIKYIVVFLLYFATCKSELCKTVCLETTDRGNGCKEMEVVEVFEKRPALFPTMREMQRIVKSGGAGFTGKGTRCPQTTTRPLPRPTTTQRPSTTTTGIRPSDPPTPTTPRQVILPPDDEDEVFEVTTRDPNGIYIDEPNKEIEDFESNDDDYEDVDVDIDVEEMDNLFNGQTDDDNNEDNHESEGDQDEDTKESLESTTKKFAFSSLWG